MKTLLTTHGEKIGLVAAIVAAIAVMAIQLTGAADPAIQEATETCDKVDAGLNSSESPRLSKPNYLQPAIDAWTKPAQAGATGDWFAYKATAVEPTWVAVLKAKTHAIGVPTMADPTAEVGKVVLSWEKHGDDTAEDSLFVVQRKAPPVKKKPSDWETLAESVADTRYEDTGVQPKTTYEYRVKRITEDPQVKDKKETAWSDPKSIRTLGVIDIKFLGGMPTMPMILVGKYISGERVERKYNVKVGEKIGKMEKESKGGKIVEVDMQTGFTVLGVKEVKKEITEEVEVTKFKDGKPYKEMEKRKRTVTTKVLEYKDDEGKTQTADLEKNK